MRPTRRMTVPLALSCVLLAAPAGLRDAAGATSTWEGGTGGWSEEDKWDPDGVPNNSGPTKYDVIVGSGTINVDIGVIIETLTFSGGSIDAASLLQCNDMLTWSAGTFDGQKLYPEGGMTINGNATKYLDGRCEVIGASTWSEGDIRGAYGFLMNTSGSTFTASSDGVFKPRVGTGADITFYNDGTFVRTGGGTTVMDGFENHGQVQVNSGVLELHSGTNCWGETMTASGSGTLRFAGAGYDLNSGSIVTGGGTVEFQHGDVHFACDYTVSGTTRFNGATVLVEEDHVIGGQAELSAGQVTLVHKMEFSSQWSWTGGTLSGDANAVAGLGCTTSVSGPGNKYMFADVQNFGQMIFSEGDIRGGFGARLTNEVDANLDLRGEVTIAQEIAAGATAQVYNYGRIVKSAGEGQAEISLPMYHYGELAVNKGTLRLRGSGLWRSGCSVADGARLVFASGTVDMLDGVQMDGNGTVEIAGASVDFYTATAVNCNAVLSSGQIGGRAWVTCRNFTWTGGTLKDSNGIAIVAGGSMTIDDANHVKYLYGGLKNSGSLEWKRGEIRAGYGAVFHNASGATVDIQGDLDLRTQIASGSPPLFENHGTVRKSAGAGTALIQVPFDNRGTVRVESGTLRLLRDGNSTGAFEVSGGAELQFAGGTHLLNSGSSVTGAGAMTVDGGELVISGTFDLTGPVVIMGDYADVRIESDVVFAGPLSLHDGTLGGSGSYTVDEMNWTGGTLSKDGVGPTPGVLVVDTGGQLTISGPDKKRLFGHIDNYGTVTWNEGEVTSGYDVLFHNKDLGTLNINNGVDLTYAAGTVTVARLFNEGTVNVAAGTGTSSFMATLYNHGEVNVLNGTFRLRHGGSGPGRFDVQPGATLAFDGSYTYDLEDGSSMDGNGAVEVRNGTVNVAGDWPFQGLTKITDGTLNFNKDTTLRGALSLEGGELGGTGKRTVQDAFTWTGGEVSGPGLTQVAASASLTISTAGVKYLYGDFTNDAHATWTGGEIRSGYSIDFTNSAGAVFDVQCDERFRSYTSGRPRIVNEGTFRKSAGTGTTDVSASFENDGSVQVQSGTLELSGGGYASGSFVVSPGATLRFDGQVYHVEDGSTITGGGSIEVASGEVDFQSDPIVPCPVTLSGGEINGTGRPHLDTLTWTGGTLRMFDGACVEIGTWTIESPGTVYLYGDANCTTAGTWTEGDIRAGYGAVLTVESGATFEATVEQYERLDFRRQTSTGDVPEVHNHGIFTKSGQGSLDMRAVFHDDATVEISDGDFTLYRGGSSEGTTTVADGASLAFYGGNFEFKEGSVLTGPGDLYVWDDTVYVNGDFQITGLTRIEQTGILSFDDDIEFTGPVELIDGTLDASGHLRIADRMTWKGGMLSGCDPFIIAAGAELTCEGTDEPKTVDGEFHNEGIVHVKEGDLSLRYDSQTTTGSFQVDPNATLEIDGGSHALQTAGQIAGGGTVQLYSGDVDFSSGGVLGCRLVMDGGAVTSGAELVVDSFLWYGGRLSAQTRIGAAGNMEIHDGSPDKQLYGNFTNEGTVRWFSGTVILGDQLVLNNAAGGLLEIAGDVDLLAEDHGHGVSDIQNAGRLLKSAGDGITNIGGDFVNTGVVEIRAGTLQFADSFTQAGGSLLLNGGRIAVDGAMNITGGTFRGSGVFSGNVVAEGGEVSPGESPGTLTIEGDYEQHAGASLLIEIDGNQPGEFDVLNVTGSAALDGTLKLRVDADYTPAYGEAFGFLAAGTLGGGFSAIDGVAVETDRSLAVVYEPNSVSAVVALPGDTDTDGDVDFFDYIQTKGNFGTMTGGHWAIGDFDGDSDVDFIDYITAKGHFGQSVGGQAAPVGQPVPPFQEVPEPATLLLLAAAAPLLVRRRRRVVRLEDGH